jgi:uroporphyrinogen decarboxylase
MKPASAGRELFAALAGGQIPDRPPVSFWRHFYTEENDPATLSEALLGFHREFGWDWIKVNARASYPLEDWGFEFSRSTHPHAKPVKKRFPVQAADDWRRITPRPATSGALGEHLSAVANVVRRAQGDPVLMTVFSPLSIAGDLVPDDETLLRHLQECPHLVASALEAITQTQESFVDEVLGAGADGVFFATTQWASRTHLEAEAYDRWGRPYDLRVLARARTASFNVLHVCHRQSLLLELSDYPVAMINWGFADEGNPDLASGYRATRKPVIGGVSKDVDLRSDPDTLYRHVQRTASRLQGVPWGCGPDCSIHPDTSSENLRAIRAALTTATPAPAPTQGSGRPV